MIEYLRKLTGWMQNIPEHWAKKRRELDALREDLELASEDLKETQRQKREAIQEDLRTFCNQGERFTYMGITMLCVGHNTTTVTDFGLKVHPCIQAEYVDQQGRIQYKEFYPHDLQILKQENTTPPTPVNNQTDQKQ